MINKRIKIMMNVFIVFMLCTAMLFTTFAMEPVIDEPDLPYWFDDAYIPGYHYAPGQFLVGIVDGVRLSKEELNNYAELFPGVDILQVKDITDLIYLPGIDYLPDGQALLLVLADESKEYMLKAMRILEQNQLVKIVDLPVPPVNVRSSPGDRKVALAWTENLIEIGRVAAYQIKVADGEWMTIGRNDLIFDEDYRVYFYVIHGLTNGVEYTFLIRAVNHAGLPGPVAQVKDTPESSGEIVYPPVEPLVFECYARNGKATLLWRGTSLETGEAAAYQIKVDDDEWMTIDIRDLIFDESIGMYYYLITHLTDGTSLRNGVEYTFHVRAVNHAGSPGPSQEAKVTPESIGSIGGFAADLISIHGFRVMPADGWPFAISGPGLSMNWPHEATIELPQKLRYSTVHRNDIVVSQDATFEIYTTWHWDLVNQVKLIDRMDDNQDWCSGIDMYIKVISANRHNYRYYVITVN